MKTKKWKYWKHFQLSYTSEMWNSLNWTIQLLFKSQNYLKNTWIIAVLLDIADTDSLTRALLERSITINSCGEKTVIKCVWDFLSYHECLKLIFRYEEFLSLFSIPLNKTAAVRARDTLAKILYDGLFQFLITSVNKKIQSYEQPCSYISFFDIAGFGKSFFMMKSFQFGDTFSLNVHLQNICQTQKANMSNFV